MRSAGGEEILNTTKNNKRRSSSSSSSSSCSQTPRRDFWKNMNLSCVHNHQHTRKELGKPNTYNTVKGITLQDFLAIPFTKDPPSSLGPIELRHFWPLPTPTPPSPPPPPPPPPPTALGRLPTTLEHYSSDHVGSCFDKFDYSDFAFPVVFGKKRGCEAENSSGDTRFKRMMKNRESAARSRARKKSYTIALEGKIDCLLQENAELLKKSEELIAASAASQFLKKSTIHRTTSAPF